MPIVQIKNPYDRAVAIRMACLTRFAKMAREPMPDDSAEKFTKTFRAIFGSVDPNELKKRQLIELGFAPWSVDGLLLIPIWLAPFLPSKVRTVSISGKIRTTLKSIPKGDRMGYLAVGVKPSK